uniref:Uncharacterized protein n=1 Tax=Meloidogyne enterolobii TaxID=390850 RepID=A0A6V7UPK5_MELEN|nr:unnamed protein product [Meloidogyne enterolobii]
MPFSKVSSKQLRKKQKEKMENMRQNAAKAREAVGLNDSRNKPGCSSAVELDDGVDVDRHDDCLRRIRA